MLSSLTKNARKAAHKSGRFIHLGLAAMALLIIASPSLAASPAKPPASPANAAVQGQSADPESPNATCPQNGQCFADVLSTNPFYAFVNRLYQQNLVTGYACGGQGEPCDQYSRPYYRPGDTVSRQQMAKFIDNARHLEGIRIENASGTTPPVYVQSNTYNAIEGHSSGAFFGVFGEGDSNGGVGVGGSSIAGTGVYGASSSGQAVYGVTTGSGTAVFGQATTSGIGVYGVSTTNVGVSGVTVNGSAGVLGDGPTGVLGTGSTYGVEGSSSNGQGVRGLDTSNGIGVFGESDGGWGVEGFSTSSHGVLGYSVNGDGIYATSSTGVAGYFAGDVEVTGNLSKGGGSFKIDDPIDPANKYLYHSFVESPDMMDIYNGEVTLDDKGEAVVQMPDWFQALNRDFRYQLTAIGAPAPDLYVAQKIEGDHFKIAGGARGDEVSWQVTGIRQDPYANVHRIPVEQDKPAGEKGKYLYPTEQDQPASAGVNYEAQQRLQQSQASKP